MKKKISLLLIMVFLVGVAPVFGSEGKQLENVNIAVTDNKSEGNSFRFGIEYRISEVSSGDYFDIQMPFAVNIDGGEFADVEHLGGTEYRLKFKDNFINIVGHVGGSQTVIENSTVNQLKINGKAEDIDDYQLPNGDSGVGSAPREPIYKNGYFLDDDTIQWSIYISNKDHLKDIQVQDMIGDGQQIIKDSIQFAILEVDSNGNVMNRFMDSNAVHSVIHEDTIQITDSTIDFKIRQLNGGTEAINIVYKSKITDPNRAYYDNQLLLEDKEKASYKVVTDDWSDINGNKPTEPEDPNPDNPEEPTPENPPKLPQVGELFMKKEYILGLMAIIVAFMLKTDKNDKS